MIVGELEAETWMQRYIQTHHNLRRIEWPDGGCYLGQQQLSVDVFKIIEAEIIQRRKELSKLAM